MNELSRLLTFMFKEDRNEIISQYNEMLDNAEDEEAMLKAFGSPTKLAVTISRSYSRDEMKLTTSVDSKDGTSSEIIRVKPVIPEQKPDGAAKAIPVVPEKPDNAYVDVIEEIRREMAAEEGIEYKPIFFKEEPTPEPEPEEVEESEEAPAEEPAEETVEAPAEEPAEEPEEEAPVEEPTEVTEEAEASEEETEEPGEAEESAEEAEKEAPVEESEEEESAEEPEEESEEEKSEEAEEENPEFEELRLPGVDEIFAELDKEKAPEKVIEKKTNVPLLILYLIVAIPVGLAAAAAMLAVELAILALGLVMLRVGFECLHFTFSGMAVFADIIMCLGVTLGVLAIGLLLLWLGIWLLIVSIPALVRGLTALGRKLCVKEVEADG